MSLKRKMVDMMMPKEFGAISGLFHVAIFSLQKAIVDLVGAGGFKEYLFPTIQEKLGNVEKLGLESLKGATMDEFVKRFSNLLKKSLLVGSTSFEKKDEETYVFRLEECFMAKDAHKVAETNGICPMAMVVASILQEYTGVEVSVEWSKLTSKGSETEFKLK